MWHLILIGLCRFLCINRGGGGITGVSNLLHMRSQSLVFLTPWNSSCVSFPVTAGKWCGWDAAWHLAPVGYYYTVHLRRIFRGTDTRLLDLAFSFLFYKDIYFPLLYPMKCVLSKNIPFGYKGQRLITDEIDVQFHLHRKRDTFRQIFRYFTYKRNLLSGA